MTHSLKVGELPKGSYFLSRTMERQAFGTAFKPMLWMPASHIQGPGFQSQLHSPFQLSANEQSSRYPPFHMREWDLVFWLWPGLSLAIVRIWGVNHWMRDLHLSISLTFK